MVSSINTTLVELRLYFVIQLRFIVETKEIRININKHFLKCLIIDVDIFIKYNILR